MQAPACIEGLLKNNAILCQQLGTKPCIDPWPGVTRGPHLPAELDALGG